MAQKELFLIGFPIERITGRTPPTLRKLLQNVAFENIDNGTPVRDSVKLVIKNTMALWKQCGIETRRSDHCEEKLQKEYLEWQKLSWRQHVKTDAEMKKRDAFKAKMNLEFDVKAKRTEKKGASEARNSPETQSTEAPDLNIEMEQSESVPIEQAASLETQHIEMEASGSKETKKRPFGKQTRAEQKRLHLDDESKYCSLLTE